MRTVRLLIALQRESGLALKHWILAEEWLFLWSMPAATPTHRDGTCYGVDSEITPEGSLARQARALQQSGSLAEHRERHVVVEHRLARLMQFRIRQAHDFGRVAIRSRLYLAAKVALTGKSGRIPAPELPSSITASLGLRQFWSLTLLESVLLPQSPGFRAEDQRIHIVPLENKQL